MDANSLTLGDLRDQNKNLYSNNSMAKPQQMLASQTMKSENIKFIVELAHQEQQPMHNLANLR